MFAPPQATEKTSFPFRGKGALKRGAGAPASGDATA